MRMSSIDPHALVATVAAAIVEHRGEAERERRLPVVLRDALRDARLFALQNPRELGGLECDLVTVLEVYEAVARLDGPVAWNVWNGNLGPAAALLDPATRAAIWTPERDTIIANSARPTGAAVAVDGGFALSGRWDIVSALDSSDWVAVFGLVMADGAPVMSPVGMPDIRAFFTPTPSITALDTWHVGAMRGTGSNTIVADGLFVADAFAVSPFAPSQIDRAVFRVPVFTSVSTGGAAVCLGMARASIDEIIAMAPSKATAVGRPLADVESAQATIASADAQVHAARLLLLDAAAGVVRAAEQSELIGEPLRGSLRAAMCHPARVSREVVTAMYELGSSSSLYVTCRLEQLFRDTHAAAQHGLLNPLQLQPAGRILLGQPAGVPIF